MTDFTGTTGNDTIIGASGNDQFTYLGGTDVVDGGSGDDVFKVDNNAPDGTALPGQTITGTQGSDSLVGTNGSDTIDGLGGSDTLTGLGGDDVLNGGDGSDELDGGLGDDVLNGGDGNDELDGGLGDDVLNGGAGDDTFLYVGATGGGSDTMVGGAGNDAFVVTNPDGSGPNHLLFNGGEGDDRLEMIANRVDSFEFYAGDGNDFAEIREGSLGNVIIDMGAGDDRVELGRWHGIVGSIGGNITLSLGTGQDILLVADLPNSLLITDFETGSLGDVIDLTHYLGPTLTQWDGSNPFASGHLQLVQNGSNTILQLDANGGANSWQSIITFQNTNIANFTPENFSGYGLFYGSDGNDNLRGSILADLIDGNNGNDILFGGSGNDRLVGGSGNDTLSGGSGTNTLDGGVGNDTVDYSDASGRIVIRLTTQTVNTGDTISGFENVTTGAGNDALIGSDVANVLMAGAGDDYIDGLGGDDVLFGGTGNDRLVGGSGNDTLNGGSGTNTLDGGSGNDTVDYSDASGRIVIRLTTQTVNTGDTISGFENVTTGAGNDALIGSDVANVLTAGAGDDYIDGLGGDDVLFGGTGNDRLVGGSGNDTLSGGSGTNTLDGGSGNDTVDYSDASGRIVIRLNTQTVNTGDTISGFENVTTGAGNDALIGSDVANVLTAGAGDDYIDGLGGDDVLFGGTGNDRLVGGSGNDTFVFDTSEGGSDQIFDFTQGDDRIAFDDQNSAFDTFAEVMSAGMQVGSDSVFDFGDGNVLRLSNTALSSLTVEDIIFAAATSSASAKPSDLLSGSEVNSGLNVSYEGFHTINANNTLAEDIQISDFDDFGVRDQSLIVPAHDGEAMLTLGGYESILHIFNPEAMHQINDFGDFEIV